MHFVHFVIVGVLMFGSFYVGKKYAQVGVAQEIERVETEAKEAVAAAKAEATKLIAEAKAKL